jgi:hypothetical protein
MVVGQTNKCYTDHGCENKISFTTALKGGAIHIDNTNTFLVSALLFLSSC